jgi:DNA repair exonuclease SbcCD ATPase subunit
MFEIEKIEFKNILRYGNEITTIDFNDFNSVSIIGKNGSGKTSSIVEPLFFGLYGKPYRKGMKKDKLINKINKKDCYVKITCKQYGNSYTIERGIKPSILKVSKNGEELKESVSKTDFQKDVIEKIIGVDYKTFKQMIIIDNKFYTPFMCLNSEEKKQIVDKLFSLIDITIMNDISKKYKIKSNERITEFQNEISLLKEKITINKQLELENNNQKILDLTNNINSNTLSLQEINNTYNIIIQSIDKMLIQEKQITNDLNKYELQQSYTQAYENKQQYEQELKQYKSQYSIIKEQYNNTIKQLSDIIKYEEYITIQKKLDLLHKDNITNKEYIDKYTIITNRCNNMLDEAYKEKDSLINIINTIKQSINDINYDINKNNEKINLLLLGKCDKCGHVFENKDEDIKHIIIHNEELIKKITNLEQQIVLNNTNKSIYEKYIKKLTVIKTNSNSNYISYNTIIDKNKNEISDIEKKLSTYTNTINTNIINTNTINKTKEELHEIINNLAVDMTTIHGSILHYESLIINIDKQFDFSKQQEYIEYNVDELKTKKQKLKQQYEENCIQKKVLEQNINTLKQNIQKDSDKVEELKRKPIGTINIILLDSKLKQLENKKINEQGMFNCFKQAEEILGKDGVKTFAIKKYLPTFNALISKYLEILGSRYIFSLNENMEEEINEKFRNVEEYTSMSAGEQARVDLAILFAMIDFSEIKNQCKTNFLILDEFLGASGSLDSEGKETIVQLLQTKINKKLLVITHDEEIKNMFEKHYEAIRDGIFSTLKKGW